MSTVTWLGWLLSALGCLGMYLAGRKSWTGWALGLATQPLWFTFAIVIHSYGLCVSPVLYAVVYGKNLRTWFKTRNTT